MTKATRNKGAPPRHSLAAVTKGKNDEENGR